MPFILTKPLAQDYGSIIEWAKSLDDETLATALLDRLLYKCRLVQLQGKSYRMQNRKTIFNAE
jgi:DNA replication protein DnaC